MRCEQSSIIPIRPISEANKLQSMPWTVSHPFFLAHLIPLFDKFSIQPSGIAMLYSAMYCTSSSVLKPTHCLTTFSAPCQTYPTHRGKSTHRIKMEKKAEKSEKRVGKDGVGKNMQAAWISDGYRRHDRRYMREKREEESERGVQHTTQ